MLRGSSKRQGKRINKCQKDPEYVRTGYCLYVGRGEGLVQKGVGEVILNISLDVSCPATWSHLSLLTATRDTAKVEADVYRRKHRPSVLGRVRHHANSSAVLSSEACLTMFHGPRVSLSCAVFTGGGGTWFKHTSRVHVLLNMGVQGGRAETCQCVYLSQQPVPRRMVGLQGGHGRGCL